MLKLRCPKCGSEDFEEKMTHVFGMWGEFLNTEVYKVCRKCGTEIIEEEKKE